MFDTSKEISVRIFSGTVKECVVRWPSDQEWIANASKRRLITEQTQDGASIRHDHLKADGELARRIRKEGAELDDAEGSEVVRKLEYCIAQLDTAVRMNGASTAVEFKAVLPGRFPVSHTFRNPTQKHYREWVTEKDRERIKRGHVETHSNLALSEVLYNELAISSEGYAGGVPIIHKDFAVRLLMEKFAEEVAKLDEEPEQPDPEAPTPTKGE